LRGRAREGVTARIRGSGSGRGRGACFARLKALRQGISTSSWPPPSAPVPGRPLSSSSSHSTFSCNSGSQSTVSGPSHPHRTAPHRAAPHPTCVGTNARRPTLCTSRRLRFPNGSCGPTTCTPTLQVSIPFYPSPPLHVAGVGRGTKGYTKDSADAGCMYSRCVRPRTDVAQVDGCHPGFQRGLGHTSANNPGRALAPDIYGHKAGPRHVGRHRSPACRQ
jgi:hypothetical protein